MRSTITNTYVSLTIFAMSILTARGEHLRSDLQAGSRVASGRKLLTAREVLTSSLHEPYSHGSEVDYLRESTSESQRPVFIIHMHVPKTAGQSFALDMRGKNSIWAQKLANATRNIAAMKSDCIISQQRIQESRRTSHTYGRIKAE